MIKDKTTLLTIDIGSNAMRATFYQKRGRNFLAVLNKRYPLRLGQEVFSTGKIGLEKSTQLVNAIKELWHICYRHHVVNVLAVGTSAIREAKNKTAILKQINQQTGVAIKLISGALEAKIIFQAVKKDINIKSKKIAHIDIGGGSTEIIISEAEKIKKVLSLPLGSVRLLQSPSLQGVETKIDKTIKNYLSSQQGNQIDILIGTGGNFKSLIKTKNLLFPKSKKKQATLIELKHVYALLTQIDYYQRIKQFALKPDRADVIVPATYTVISLMTHLKIKKLVISQVGLENGLLEIFKKDFN